MAPNSEGTASAPALTVASHGIEVAVEFKPVEHPIEPFDNDRPIQCPLPEPSILNVRLNPGFFLKECCFVSLQVRMIEIIFMV